MRVVIGGAALVRVIIEPELIIMIGTMASFLFLSWHESGLRP
jgi:hypothetical protein